MSAPESPLEPDAMTQVKTDSVPVARPIGSEAKEAIDATEPQQLSSMADPLVRRGPNSSAIGVQRRSGSCFGPSEGKAL